MNNRKKKSFVILALVLAVALYLSDQQEQTATQNNSNEIVDMIVIDQAKHDAAQKKQAEALIEAGKKITSLTLDNIFS